MLQFVKLNFLILIFLILIITSSAAVDVVSSKAAQQTSALKTTTNSVNGQQFGPKCQNSVAAAADAAAAVAEKPQIKFYLPFMDLEIQNQRNVHIIQEPNKNQVFLLHGNELFQVFVNSKERRLSLIGYLAGGVGDMELLGAKVVFWRNYLLLVVALTDYLEVYQIPVATIDDNAKLAEMSKNVTQNFEPIQQLTLSGKFQKLFLLPPTDGRVMLLVAVNFTKIHAKLRTFEWLNTYFEPIEDLTLPTMHVLQQIGNNNTKLLICGRVIKHQSKTILTIYELQPTNLNLRNRQTLTVNSQNVHAVTFHGINYIIACMSKQKKCNIFRMSNGQFNIYKKRASKDLAFDKFTSGADVLVGARQNEIKVYTNGRLDCYGGFTTNDTDVTSILTHKNAENELFLLVNYKRTFHTLLRTVQIEVSALDVDAGAKTANDADMEEVTEQHKHQHMFEEAIAKLRSLLLKRRYVMDTYRQAAKLLVPKPTSLKLQNPVIVHNGQVTVVNIVDKNLCSPTQLYARIAEMQQKYRRTRFVREIKRADNLNIEQPLRLKAQKMFVKNLIYDGDILAGFNLNNLTLPLPILTVNPKLTTKILHTQNLLTHQNYKSRQSAVERTTPTQINADAKLMKVRKLQVKNINNVSWTEFMANIFRKNNDTKIEGRLIVESMANITSLQTSILNGLIVEQLFNLKQPQLINANILISRFFVTDLEATTVNGLNFVDDIVFSNRDALIESRVIFHQLFVAGDLLLAQNKSAFRNVELVQPKIRQFYTGTVVINGSLTIDTLLYEHTNVTNIIVSGINISHDNLRKNYLLRNETQFINTPIVFGNAKITAPVLNTNYLNNHPTNEHLLRTFAPQNSEKPLMLVFLAAKVDGSIICKSINSNILNLHKNAVRHGDVANITAIKVFKAPFEVNNLLTLELNDLPVNDLVLKEQLTQGGIIFNGTKTFVQIQVTNDFQVNGAMNSLLLNNLPLRELLNYDYHLHSLYLPHKLRASNVVFHKINGIGFDKIFDKLNVKAEQLVLHKDLIIEGNVEFNESLNVRNSINDVKWQEYVNSLVHINENTEVAGQKIFQNELIITKSLKTSEVNDINMQDAFENILLKTKAQIITGYYTIDNIQVNNVDVTVVNDIPTASFIDTRENDIIIDSDIVAPKVNVEGSISGNLTQTLQFAHIEQRIQNLANRSWRNLVIHGNATWSRSNHLAKRQHDQLQYLHKNAVLRADDNVITGNVRLKIPKIQSMFSKAATLPANIDLDFIVKDSLYKNTKSPQVVLSHKMFAKPLQLQSIQAVTNFNAPIVNNIDILRFNTSLYRVSSEQPIVGPLQFKTTPTFGNVTTAGTINGLDMRAVYVPTTATNDTNAPVIEFINSLKVENLQMNLINDFDLNYLLKNRVTKRGNTLEIFGHLTFENLALNNEIQLQTINDIPIDNLVFKKSKQLQALTGDKIIDGNLVLAGPAQVMNLNGENLINNYQQSIFTNRNQRFESLTVENVTFNGGLVLPAEMAVGRVANSDDASPTAEVMQQKLHKIQLQKQLQNSNIKNSTNLLYLDFDFDTKILWQKTLNETIDNSYVFELKRLSKCERQMLHVQKSYASNSIYLTNFTTNFIKAQEKNISVKAENYCRKMYRKVKSKITITINGGSAGDGIGVRKIFGMKKCIENIEIYMPNEQLTQNVVFVLLHAVDFVSNRSEVRILKIDNDSHEMSDWQAVKQGVDRMMRLFRLTNQMTILITSGYINKQPVAVIYHFDSVTLKFTVKQIIEGDYDIFDVFVVEPKTMKIQLILGCRHCQRLNVYDYKAGGEFKIFQILKLPILIDKLQIFKMRDDTIYLLVLSADEQNYYHLYKYAFIEGWLQKTYGYFPNIKLALTLKNNNKQMVAGTEQEEVQFLLCNNVKCGLVKAFIK